MIAWHIHEFVRMNKEKLLSMNPHIMRISSQVKCSKILVSFTDCQLIIRLTLEVVSLVGLPHRGMMKV